MPTKKDSYSLDNIMPAGAGSIYDGATNLLMPSLIKELLSNPGSVLQDSDITGTLVKELDDLFALIKSYGGKFFIKKKGLFSFVWDNHSFFNMWFSEKTKNATIEINYLNDSLTELASIIEKDYVSKIKKNLIFSIIRNTYGLAITSMGDGSSALIKENYTPDILSDIDYVIEAFGKKPPVGRIAILNGEPGCGKTFLIRSILTRMDVVFLIVPPNLIDSLDKPEFMPLLISIKNDHAKPIVMVIEDGDACLVPRKGDNISTISSLLNLSDGILGSIIDIKMIITTNADIKEMDEAIMRPGRLCKNIHVGPLPYEQANKIYQRLTKDTAIDLEYRKVYTLAEIYDIVNRVDAPPITRNSNMNIKRQIGFGRTTDNGDRNSKELSINKSDIIK